MNNFDKMIENNWLLSQTCEKFAREGVAHEVGGNMFGSLLY